MDSRIVCKSMLILLLLELDKTRFNPTDAFHGFLLFSLYVTGICRTKWQAWPHEMANSVCLFEIYFYSKLGGFVVVVYV